MAQHEAVCPAARVLIVEDDPQLADALFRSLNRAGLRPLAPVCTGSEAVRRAARERPDLIIMDIALPGDVDGLEAADRIRRTPPFPPVLFLTASSDDATVDRAIRLGAVGYVLKPFEPAQLLLSVRVAIALGRASGLTRVPPVSRWSGAAHPDLTAREAEIVRLLEAQGRVRVVAQALDISYHTVRNHLKHIFRKFGVSSQYELLAAVRSARAPVDRLDPQDQ